MTSFAGVSIAVADSWRSCSVDGVLLGLRKKNILVQKSLMSVAISYQHQSPCILKGKHLTVFDAKFKFGPHIVEDSLILDGYHETRLQVFQIFMRDQALKEGKPSLLIWRPQMLQRCIGALQVFRSSR